MSLSLIASELAALAAASWLHSLQQAAYEAWLDDVEEAQARAREAVQQTVERQFAGKPMSSASVRHMFFVYLIGPRIRRICLLCPTGDSGSLWSQHMRQKYGVDESQVKCNAAAVRQVAVMTGDAPA